MTCPPGRGGAEDQSLLGRKGNDEIKLSCGGNPPLYPKWQESSSKHQPPMMENDQIFPAAAASAGEEAGVDVDALVAAGTLDARGRSSR